MDFLVTIEQFDGPLDLLLHLVKENKMELMDLDMDVLATQYINYIHAMQDIHLVIASEYLVELASMIEYKSRKLLPREEVVVEEEYEEDTREKLVERLIEYQKFKEASNILKVEYENRQQQFTRPVASVVDEWKIPIEMNEMEEQSPYELMKAMNRVLNRMKIVKPYETKITVKEISLEERLQQVKDRFKHRKDPIPFEEAFQDCATKHVVIVTFLSILDLIHQKWLTFTCDENENVWLFVYQYHPEFKYDTEEVEEETTMNLKIEEEPFKTLEPEEVETSIEESIIDEQVIDLDLEQMISEEAEEVVEEAVTEELETTSFEEPEKVEQDEEFKNLSDTSSQIQVSEEIEESVNKDLDESITIVEQPSMETEEVSENLDETSEDLPTDTEFVEEKQPVEEAEEIMMAEPSWKDKLAEIDYSFWLILGIVVTCGLLLVYLLLKDDPKEEVKQEPKKKKDRNLQKYIKMKPIIKKNKKKEILKKLNDVNQKLVDFNSREF